MNKSFLSDVFLKYFLVAFGLVQLGVFSPEAHAVLPVPARPTSFPLSPVSYTTPGTVVGWGENADGQRTIPVGLSNVVQVAAGGFHSLALESDGTVVGWGFDGDGQATIPVGLSNVVQVAAGAFHSLALESDGTVAGWGYNGDGQRAIPVGLSNVVQVAAGLYHSLALQANGTVVGWGRNGDGQITIPVGLSSVVQVAAGGFHSLALESDGTVVGWGSDFSGQATIPVGLSNVVQVAAGYYHSLALKSDGTVVGWGFDAYGQATIPSGLSNVFQVAAGAYHNLALVPLSQTIGSFATIPTKMYGSAPFTVTAPAATSGLTVALSVVSGPATISGNTVTLTGVGTVVLAANQSGNGIYSAATQVTTSFQVNMASQTIGSFTTIPTKTYGSAPFTVTAPAATSGLTVVLSVVSGPATISGNTVTLTGAGTVVLAANQAGNGLFTAATRVTTSFVINKGSQSIAKFSSIAAQKKKSSFALNVPRASSGLTITVKVLSGPATIANNRVTTTRPGIVLLEATQSGNGNYNAAVPVTCKFVVK